MSRLFVGGLSYDTTVEGLTDHVEKYGYRVEDTHIMTDRETRKSRGFGFVTLGEGEDEEKAIGDLNGTKLDGRKLTVNKALPKPQTSNTSKR